MDNSLDYYIDLNAPSKNQTMSVTTLWTGTENQCLRIEFFLGNDEGDARTCSEFRINIYKPYVVDELITKLETARDKLWPKDA